MYTPNDLQSCLFGLIGFKQTNNPGYPSLSPSLLETSTGLYFQDAHPLITIENIDQSFVNYDAYAYDAYSAITAYSEGDQIKYDDVVYESLQDANTGNQPDVSPLYWQEVNLLSLKLRGLVNGAINKIASYVFTAKKLRESTKTLLENAQLFDGNGSLQDKEIKLNRFVGFRLTVSSHRDLVATIRRVGTQFTEANPDFKLYVFHTSQVEPLAILEFATTRVNSFQWTKLDHALKYLSGDYAPGGSFRIGYYEQYLEGMAINRGYDFSTYPQPCNCNNWYSLWNKWSKFISVEPFYVYPEVQPDPDGSGAEMWDYTQEALTYSKSYGLNFDISVTCDVTDFMCREKGIFTDALLNQVAVDVLRQMAYGTRNNVIAKEVKDLANYALTNKDNSNFGLETTLKKALEALDFDTSDLNEACLPCNNSAGPDFRVYGQ